MSELEEKPLSEQEEDKSLNTESDQVSGDEKRGSSVSGGQDESDQEKSNVSHKYVAYTVKLPAHQLSALQSIWLELKKLYGSHSPDKSGMIEAAISAWLKRWDGPEQDKLLQELLEIRENTRKRQYRKKRD